jgi:chorismate synthase
MLRYLTAGESHGPALTGILEGMPADVPVQVADLNADLGRRMMGYGRGGRMKIEKDEVTILGGVRHGKTLGSPISLLIHNRDWTSWRNTMSPAPLESDQISERPPLTRPRPGHADLVGGLKYGHRDLRNVLERASARETAMRVAVGAICKGLLREFEVQIVGHVVQMGGISAATEGLSTREIAERAEASPLRCADAHATREIMAKVDEAQARGTSLGGVFEVQILNAPIGLGTHVHWDRRLDGRLAQALVSIQAVKGVEIGPAFEVARRFGCEVQDEIFYEQPEALNRASGFFRKTNFAGGLEGGITTGQPIVLRAAMKPISTQYQPLTSVDIVTKEETRAGIERSDVTAVPAAAVIGEAVVAFEIARAMREKFAGDSLAEMHRNFEGYLSSLRTF